MSLETNTIELSSRHQLVDLNKKLVNFKLDFKVTSPDMKEFDALVLTEDEINSFQNLDNIEMKKAPGKISGTIIADNNKYKNYFILLKADELHKVDVETIIEEIPPKEIEEPVNLDLNVKDIEGVHDLKETPFYQTRGCWVLLVLCLLLLGFYFRDYIFKRKKTTLKPVSEVVNIAPVVETSTAGATIPQTSASGKYEITKDLMQPVTN